MALKKKMKILVSGFLVTMLVFLTGCTGDKGKGATEPSASAPSSASASPIAAPEPVTITWMRYEHPIQVLNPNSVVIQESLKRKNVQLKIQSAPQSNYDDKKKTLIATNTMPDVLLVKQDDISNFADTGIFLDLTNYLDKMPNFKQTIADNPEINKNKIDGKLYGFPLALRAGATQSGQVPMIRVDLLEKLSIPKPTTYEELYEALKKFKEAYPDTFPFTSRAANGLTGTENLLNPIAFGFGSGYTNISGAKVYFDPHLNEYKFGPFMPEFKEAVAYLHKLYKEKILDPDYTTATSQIWQEKLSSGKSLYYQDNTGFGAGFNETMKGKEPGAKFDMLDPLAGGPNGVKREQLYQLDHLSESYVISSKVKNPDAIIAYIDWLYSEEGIRLTNWGVDGEHYKMNGDKPEKNKEFYDKFKDEKDSNAVIKSKLGVGYLGFALNTDETLDATLTPEAEQIDFLKLGAEWTAKNYEKIKTGFDFRMAYDPAFTKEERETLKQLRTKLDAYLAQTMDRFIMIDGALEKDWDSFLQQCRDNGAEEIAQIYNTALARVK